MIIPCNTRAHTWTHSDGSQGGFRPRGKLVLVGEDLTSNPAELLDAGTWSARLFVGLSVGKQAKWTIEDVVAAVRAYQKARRRPQDSSFLIQRGVYTHRKSRRVVEEDSVQIIMLRTSSRPSPKRWKEWILELAEHLATTLQQESIIVEFQEDGVSRGTYEVRP